METAIVYYTFGGSTKKEAQRLAEEGNASLCCVQETRNRRLLGTFIPGCPLAMKRKPVAIKPLDIDLQNYDRIIIGCPVWAGYPAPAFNAIVQLLPAGKDVELFFCSGGGDTQKSQQGTRDLIEAKGCTVTAYRDVQTSAPPKKSKE